MRKIEAIQLGIQNGGNISLRSNRIIESVLSIQEKVIKLHKQISSLYRRMEDFEYDVQDTASIQNNKGCNQAVFTQSEELGEMLFTEEYRTDDQNISAKEVINN